MVIEFFYVIKFDVENARILIENSLKCAASNCRRGQRHADNRLRTTSIWDFFFINFRVWENPELSVLACSLLMSPAKSFSISKFSHPRKSQAKLRVTIYWRSTLVALHSLWACWKDEATDRRVVKILRCLTQLGKWEMQKRLRRALIQFVGVGFCCKFSVWCATWVNLSKLSAITLKTWLN